MGKVPKKRFKAGLESLFDETTEAFAHEKVALVDEKKEDEKIQKTTRVRSRSTGKSFTSDLDSLLEEALAETESDDNKHEQKAAKGSFEPKAKRRAVTISGLDALIRKTVDINFSQDKNAKNTKRMTISVDKMKLQKLKQIARIEKSYLKDIISKLIGEYIKKYDYENY